MASASNCSENLRSARILRPSSMIDRTEVLRESHFSSGFSRVVGERHNDDLGADLLGLPTRRAVLRHHAAPRADLTIIPNARQHGSTSLLGIDTIR